MSLFLGNEKLISEVNMDNFFSLEQRKKYKYDIQDAVCNESKSTINNNNNNNNNNNSNSKDDADDNDDNNYNKGNGKDDNDENANNYNNSNNKEDDIVSIMSETVVNNILNP